jgi:RNA polymerase sigma-70 factor (ECF subfamily)
MEHKFKVAAFEAEALPHLGDLYGTAVRLVMDRSEAEDIVQETYLQAWKSYHRYAAGTNCRAWLYRIFFYKLDHYRRRQRTRCKHIKESSEASADVAACEPPVRTGLRDKDVLRALDSLPLKYREVVWLADVEECAYKEIAEALNIPIGTVMSRLCRGRTRLRKLLAGVAREYGILKDCARASKDPQSRAAAAARVRASSFGCANKPDEIAVYCTTRAFV